MMALSGKAVDKLVFGGLYVVLIALVVWGGSRLINYSLDSRFYKDFLLKWEVCLRAYSVKSGIWPHFSGSNHVEYMDNLNQLISRSGVSLPKSNTGRSYVYRIKKIGEEQDDIFILCFSNRIILYGISKDTFTRIDRFVDGELSKEKGFFTGYLSKDGRTMIGLWRL
ncbi:MAG: hypothetical protein B6I32_03540 [Desulfobacterium sp. 4572_20]|nr:MAG: hypothetical protein B6I32_03540 [Desulfobacterium sp. 4572_20]HDH87906.1 hypothetical protein [Desulfobacteraceae bacterium]